MSLLLYPLCVIIFVFFISSAFDTSRRLCFMTFLGIFIYVLAVDRSACTSLAEFRLLSLRMCVPFIFAQFISHKDLNVSAN